MHLGSRHRDAVELQVEGGAGIVHHRDGIAVVRRRAAGGFDAHVAHGTDHHHFRDALIVQQFFQRGAAKRVGVVLDDDRLALPGRHGRDDLHARRVGGKEGRVGLCALMAHMDEQLALGARRCNDTGRMGQGRFQAHQRELAGGEVFVLKVNDDGGAFAHGVEAF